MDVWTLYEILILSQKEGNEFESNTKWCFEGDHLTKEWQWVNTCSIISLSLPPELYSGTVCCFGYICTRSQKGQWNVYRLLLCRANIPIDWNDINIYHLLSLQTLFFPEWLHFPLVRAGNSIEANWKKSWKNCHPAGRAHTHAAKGSRKWFVRSLPISG